MHMGEDVDQDLNCKVLTNYTMCQDFEILALELKLLKTNGLIIGTYKPPSLSDITFTSGIKNLLVFYQPTHGHILVIGEFNMVLDNPNFNVLIEDHELSTLISEPTSHVLKVLIQHALTIF